MKYTNSQIRYTKNSYICGCYIQVQEFHDEVNKDILLICQYIYKQNKIEIK